ncbi:MAG: uracil-DNA glycosylase [Alcaligenaceae bacterium]|nr:uracil-DNA glycosylase [Alcaligenaceae bacterium]
MVSNNLIPPVPVRPNLNGLQALWLQESGIDRLWGEPLLALGSGRQVEAVSAVKPGVAGPGHLAGTKESGRQAEEQAFATSRSVVSQRPSRQLERPIPAQISQEETPPAVVLRPDLGQLDWPGLRDSVANCTSCALSEHRRQTVFGEGALPADWMFVEEAPGEQDDWHGQPFMGKAGTLFDNMLKALGLQRETVFITPLVKCRPVANIAPSKEEVASCLGFLQAQIERVQPKCIVVFGRAANLLLGSNETLEALRAKDCFINDANGKQVPVVVTYHPNHLMVAQADKARVWQDLQTALRIVRSSS